MFEISLERDTFQVSGTNMKSGNYFRESSSDRRLQVLAGFAIN